MHDAERPPRLEERWTIENPANHSRTIYIEPGNRGDESYLLEQMRSLAGELHPVPGDYLRLYWSPAVPR